jgi:hypothetical protein
MLTRSYWVLITYVKRPLSWLFAAAIVLCMIVPFHFVDDKVRSVENDVISGDAIRTFEQLEVVLASDPARPVELDYGQLFSLATQKVVPVPRGATRHIGPDEQALIHASLEAVESLQNVIAMDAGYAVDQATIHRIAKFRSLKRLSIFADLGYESLDLRPLSNLSKLEELQLGVVSRVESLQPLADLPSLQTLGIGQAMILHKHGLDELAKIPRLQVLSLPDLRSFPGLQDTVGKLKQSKTLQRINYGISWDDADVLDEVQSQVASIHVAPSKFRGARHVVLFFALLAVAAVGFPTMQLAGQLSLPSSCLAPLYRMPHYFVAGLMIAALIMGAILGLIYVGANALTAASLMLCAGCLHFWSGTRIPSKGYVATKTGLVNLLIALPIGTAPFLVLASRFFRPMWMENYLMSGQVVIPVGCFVIAAWLGWLGYRNLNSRLRTRAELGLPVVLTFHDLQAQSVEWANIPSSAFPANLEMPMGMKLPVVAKAALAVTLLSMPLRALGYEDHGRMALMTCLGAAIVCVLLMGVKWWQDMPYFAATTIRPPDRKGHVHRLMYAVRSDLYGLTPLLLACVITIGLLGPWKIEGVGVRILHGVVAVASVTLAVYAAILWILTIRSVIGIAIAFFICYLPCSMMMMEIVVLERFASPLHSAIVVVLSGCAIAAVSFIAILLARRHLVRVEWARLR